VAASHQIMTNFDRVADAYRLLEYLAFGQSLETARFCHLPALHACRNVLIVGEGDGRFLVRLLRLVPDVRVRVLDSSERMLALAAERVTAIDRDRVSFECVDVRTAGVKASAYEAIVTLFVLDCFSADDVARLVHRLERSLQAGGLWLFADFVAPPRGWRRWRAAIWIRALYAFFGWQTGLPVRRLPPSEQILSSVGLRPESTSLFQHGLLASVLYRTPSGDPQPGATR
jgi:ubiquinone/menaquinone biosynthesis C-methylase UbiE